MQIEKIALGSVKDRAGRTIAAWIECRVDRDKADDGKVIVCLDAEIGKCHYEASTIFQHALSSSDEYFIVTDGFDGKQDIYIPDEEIRSLAKNVLEAIPGTMGRIRMIVDFAPVDMSVPF